MLGLRGHHAKSGEQALLHFGPIASQGPSIDAIVGDYDFAGDIFLKSGQRRQRSICCHTNAGQTK